MFDFGHTTTPNVGNGRRPGPKMIFNAENCIHVECPHIIVIIYA